MLPTKFTHLTFLSLKSSIHAEKAYWKMKRLDFVQTSAFESSQEGPGKVLLQRTFFLGN